MAMIEYVVVRRNMPATKGDERSKAHLAVVLVRHENGQPQTVFIDEELIRFYGEGIIEQEVKRAAALPSDVSLGNPLGRA
jgi:hypothetical protein